MSIKRLPSLDSIERVPHTELSERLDELFERIDKENIAFVITEDGKDKCVLCPYDWFDFALDDDFGCMVNCAIRNELNHPSDDTEAVQRFVKKHIDSFNQRTVAVAIEDIEYAIHSQLRTLADPVSWNDIRNLLLNKLYELKSKKRDQPNA